jgi:hypothetical protein
MQFLIGKKVAVLDDVLKGVIVSIDNQTISIKDSDGMVYQYQQKELVLIEEDLASITTVPIPQQGSIMTLKFL